MHDDTPRPNHEHSHAAKGPLELLAERANGGDRDALEGVVRGLQDRMYHLALRILGHQDHARDATQEVLILLVTHLSTFRGESSLTTWAYRIATRHLLRQRRRGRRWQFESLANDDLGQPPNEIAAHTLARADQRLLEEETFVGCTQAMLQALDKPQRLAFVLGGILELEAPEAAWVLGITEVAFRKRLSRARATLDTFMEKHCGVANPKNACRCAHQVNLNVARKCLNPDKFRYAVSPRKTSLEVLNTLGEIRHVRRSLELYRTQPAFAAPEDFAARVRETIAATTAFSLDGEHPSPH